MCYTSRMSKKTNAALEERGVLFLRLPAWLIERVRAEAALREISAAAVVKELLVERYRPEAREARQ
jgi:hypothetical protein